MKPLIKSMLFVFGLVIMFLSSCKPEGDQPISDPPKDSKDSILYKIVYDTITIDQKEVVVIDSIPYFSGEIILDANTANAKIFRDSLKKLNFKRFKTCPCSGKMELWRYQGKGTIDVIGVVQNPPPSGGPVGGLSLNYVIRNENPDSFSFTGYDIKGELKTSNCATTAVKIAVTDSGVDTTKSVLHQSRFNWDIPALFKNCKPIPKTKFGQNVYGIGQFYEPWDEDGHGTHINGIIAGATEQNFNVRGVKFQFINVKIMDDRTHRGDLFETVCGLYYALDQKAKVINISWGFYDTVVPKPLITFIKEAEKRKVIIVAGMGNNGWNLDVMKIKFWPACFAKTSNVISVGAVDGADKRASFSNISNAKPEPSYMTVAALGVDVVSTYPKHLQPTGSKTGFARNSGTSMSTPFVSRTVAAMLGIKPSLTPFQVKDLILQQSKLSNVKPDTIIRIHQHDKVINTICPLN